MAKKQDNRRKIVKTSKRYPKPGRSFNYLQGADREWAKSNRFDVAEYCVGVKGGKSFSGSTDTIKKCGDGRSGFTTRRSGQDDVTMEIGLDGQYKKKRSTLVRPKSARCAVSRRARRVDGSVCSLICAGQLVDAMRDPIEVAERAKSYRKMKREEKFYGVNQNKARRAAKRNRKAQLSVAQ